MNFNDVSDAIMLVFDTLKDDSDSVEILELIDTAECDDVMREGLRKAVKRLDIVNPAVSKVVQEKAKGFSF